MKRYNIQLEEIAEYKSISLAFYKAVKGKRYRPDVIRFTQNIETNLAQLGEAVRQEKLPYNRFRSFRIYDPKCRTIHAACFEDRIFHHALMNKAGSVFERTMSESSYACRPNKGVHRAVSNVQKFMQRYEYYVKVDIASYFSRIDHEVLLQLLSKRFKGRDITRQFERVIYGYRGDDGKCGLPIGSLTSQYFANYYLDGVDRLLANLPEIRAHIRYMDDIIWWCNDKSTAQNTLKKIAQYLREERMLELKLSIQIQKTKQGVTYCGFRLLQGAIKLSRRRKKRYQERRQYWERQYQLGRIDAHKLQLAYASVHAITDHTDSVAWRRKNLQLHPALDV